MNYAKNNPMKNSLLIAAFAAITILSACKKPTEDATPAGQYESGVFIVNEGPFLSGTGTISHYNRNDKTATNNIFQQANIFPLGNIVQSLNIFNGKGYIVVNQANKIEVVESATFKYTGTIRGLDQPRYIVPINDTKAYVSIWGSDGMTGAIKVVNLATNSVSSTITTGRKGMERMVKKDNFVYATCKGGNGNDSVVTIINSTTDAVLANLEVGPNPDGIVKDANGNIWVLCVGKFKSDYSSLAQNGRLVKINTTSNTVETSFTFSSIYAQPTGLTLNQDKTKLVYVYDGKVYAQDITATSLQSTVLVNRSFYGLGIDPNTNIMYGADAGNYSSNGKIVRFNIDGSKIDSFNVGVIPGNIFFK